MSASREGPLPEADRLILGGSGGRGLTPDELHLVLEYVARRGFDPSARERVRARLAGTVWRGRGLQARDRLPPAELKYVWHVLTRREWPPGTGLADYVASIRRVILDPTSGVFVGRYQGVWQLSVARHSGDLRGPEGSDWVLVEYRPVIGHWVTAYQPRESLEEALGSANRDGVRWLREQRHPSE